MRSTVTPNRQIAALVISFQNFVYIVDEGTERRHPGNSHYNHVMTRTNTVPATEINRYDEIIDCNTFKSRLNTDTSSQNSSTTFLENDMTEQVKKSAVVNAIAIPLLLCFSCFVLLRRFRENLTKPFYFHLSRTCSSSDGTPSVISLASMT